MPCQTWLVFTGHRCWAFNGNQSKLEQGEVFICFLIGFVPSASC